jgi:hypothetical protein
LDNSLELAQEEDELDESLELRQEQPQTVNLDEEDEGTYEYSNKFEHLERQKMYSKKLVKGTCLLL